MTEHTPLPWRVGFSDGSGGGDPNDYNDYYAITSTVNDEEVVTGASGDSPEMRSWCVGIENPADAALIVKAVNCHDDLVTALERAKGELVYMAEKMPHTNAREALRVVNAALAKAKRLDQSVRAGT